jgi:hypothetical protein
MTFQPAPRKGHLQILDDLAIASHRPIQSLEVAVDDERQVVELLARGERKTRSRFRLVHLSVAEHAPDAPAIRVEQPAVAQIAHETRLVDRAYRANAHRARRRLPEVGHEPGMGIGCETGPADLLPITLELRLGQPALEEGASVDARRRVRLEEDDNAAPFAVRPTEEMIEADFENLGGRGVARDMSAKFAIGCVRAHNHRQRVPANDRGDARLHLDVAGKRALFLKRDGVSIRAEGQHVGEDAKVLRLAVKSRQNKFRPLGARHAEDRFERI